MPRCGSTVGGPGFFWKTVAEVFEVLECDLDGAGWVGVVGSVEKLVFGPDFGHDLVTRNLARKATGEVITVWAGGCAAFDCGDCGKQDDCVKRLGHIGMG